MALPTSGLKLSDVIAHFQSEGVGTFTKLSQCIDAFDPSGANNTYYASPCDRLGDFRGYQHPAAGETVYPFFMTEIGLGNSFLVCNGVPDYTRYKNSSSTVNNGDIIYIDNPGTTRFNGQDIYYVDNNGIYFKVSTTGVVSEVDYCAAV